MENLLLIGHEWRKGEGLKEGPQVNYNNRFNICTLTSLFHVSILVWDIRFVTADKTLKQTKNLVFLFCRL